MRSPRARRMIAVDNHDELAPCRVDGGVDRAAPAPATSTISTRDHSPVRIASPTSGGSGPSSVRTTKETDRRPAQGAVQAEREVDVGGGRRRGVDAGAVEVLAQRTVRR